MKKIMKAIMPVCAVIATLLCCSMALAAGNESGNTTVKKLPDIEVQTKPSVNDKMVEASTGYTGYFLTADDVDDAGQLEINTQCVDLYRAGYPYVLFSHEKTAKEIYDLLPSYDILILHGHGFAGGLVCVDETSSESYMYSYSRSLGRNDQTLSNYSTRELSKAKLVIFSSCLGGLAPTQGISLAEQAYNKGAKLTLGYKVNVALAEYYSRDIILPMSYGETFAEAIVSADASFSYMYPTLARENNPGLAMNRAIWGNQDMTIN